MVYEAEGMVLHTVNEALAGSVNDVVVCQDMATPARPYYRLLVVKSPETARRMLTVFAESQKPRATETDGLLKVFSQGEELCFLFPFRAERRMRAFAPGQLTSGRVREAMAVNMAMECLSSPLPWPLLYLVLMQDSVSITAANEIYFNPGVDLEGLDAAKGEADCVNLCVRILLDYLDGGSKKLPSFVLMHKKLERHAYQSFPELYRDIRVSMLPEKKPTLWQRVKGWWYRNKDVLFRVLLVLCALLVLVALVILISQLIYGDVPLFRIFENRFERIGTETLT